MNEPDTKNFWTVDLDGYTPILKTVDEKIIAQADFSLAEAGLDSGERLRQLVDFIRNTRKRLENCFPGFTSRLPLGVSQRVAEEIVYLAYWKNQRLECRVDKASYEVVVWVYFPNQPELNCILDQFAGGLDPCNELQGWLDFFYRIISDHLEILQIDLAMHESVYGRLAIPYPKRVFIDVHSGDCTTIQESLAHTTEHNTPADTLMPSC
jgi:hypothetical protein